jgi:hypothetical protein
LTGQIQRRRCPKGSGVVVSKKALRRKTHRYGFRGELNQTSYLASLRSRAAATRGGGKWRDGREFMIDAIKYLIYI